MRINARFQGACEERRAVLAHQHPDRKETAWLRPGLSRERTTAHTGHA